MFGEIDLISNSLQFHGSEISNSNVGARYKDYLHGRSYLTEPLYIDGAFGTEMNDYLPIIEK